MQKRAFKIFESPFLIGINLIIDLLCGHGLQIRAIGINLIICVVPLMNTKYEHHFNNTKYNS
jgi:hypothetical protein